MMEGLLTKEERERYVEQYEKKRERFETDTEYREKCIIAQDEDIARQGQEVRARNEAGRYTIVEASRFIADNSKSIEESIRSKLEQSANRGELTFYQPHSLGPYDKRTAVLGWYEECFYDDLNNWLASNAPRLGCVFPKPGKVGNDDEGSQTDAPPKQSASKTKDNEAPKPWLILDQRDPEPKYHWYTPARYFARQLVIDNSTLLLKRDQLAIKIVQSLSKVGIYKRGGKKPFDPNTILKALSNIDFS